ncbi:MAG: hypothetical protein ACOY99_02235 [Pseudomonadota bacterium]
MPEFSHFIAIDWSGAKTGYRHKLQVALCPPGRAAPRLIKRPGGWTRAGILEWLTQDLFPQSRALVGFDFSFAPPFLDKGAYLVGEALPGDARGFWAYVDACCEDADLGAASFLESRHRRHFYFGKADGEKAPYMRLRRCERRFNAVGGGKPSSVFDAIGAAQVAKASFAGMRLLHRLAPEVAVWPFDEVGDEDGPLVVEIYCRLFLRLAGGRGVKLRSVAALNAALARLQSQPVAWGKAPISDDETDALIAAAGLRHLAMNGKYWRPAGLSDSVRTREGWTFGID